MTQDRTSDPDPTDFVGLPPRGDADPEEFTSADQSMAVSEDTGTIYDALGETETTPHDEELLAADDDEETTP